MRATLNIPDDLISEVQKLSGEKSKTKAIVIAMQEFVKEKKLRKILALRGKIRIEDVTKELDELEMEERQENDKRWRDR
ncbi:MAG: type II toxin-antitoxin system VapB family antitoxin [Nitrospiraceae bacterium]|nr:type II toxin-antitoxin system VapB family antitoxin [Nitrospiraceae bacterium]